MTQDVLERVKNEIKFIVSPRPIVAVYLLVKGSEIVYVGKTINLFSRLANHVDKDYDRAYCIECSRKDLDLIERTLIHVFAPKHNITHNLKRLYGGPWKPRLSDPELMKDLHKRIKAGVFSGQTVVCLQDAGYVPGISDAIYEEESL